MVHGDLGAENVLWEWACGLPHLSGVLDRDDVALGDPAEGLAAIGASHGTASWNECPPWAAGAERGLLTRIAMVRGTSALQQALCALRDGDEAELTDGLADYR